MSDIETVLQNPDRYQNTLPHHHKAVCTHHTCQRNVMTVAEPATVVESDAAAGDVVSYLLNCDGCGHGFTAHYGVEDGSVGAFRTHTDRAVADAQFVVTNAKAKRMVHRSERGLYERLKARLSARL